MCSLSRSFFSGWTTASLHCQTGGARLPWWDTATSICQTCCPSFSGSQSLRLLVIISHRQRRWKQNGVNLPRWDSRDANCHFVLFYFFFSICVLGSMRSDSLFMDANFSASPFDCLRPPPPLYKTLLEMACSRSKLSISLVNQCAMPPTLLFPAALSVTEMPRLISTYLHLSRGV